MLEFDKPAQLIGDNLAAEIEASGFTLVRVRTAGDMIEIEGVGPNDRPIDENHRPAIRPVVDAHTGQPTAAQTQTRAAVERSLADLALLRNKAETQTAFTAEDLQKALRALVVLRVAR